MRLLKIIFIICGLIALLISFAFKDLPNAILNTAQDAVTVEGQEVKFEGGELWVTTPIKSKEIIVFSDTELCIPHADFSYGFDYNSDCYGNKCTTRISMTGNAPIPEKLDIFRLIRSKCYHQEINNVAQYVQRDYQADFAITPEMKVQMGFDADKTLDIQKVKGSLYYRSTVFGYNNSQRFTLKYDEFPKDGDKLRIENILTRIKFATLTEMQHTEKNKD